jgi:hypothetical protein
MSDLLSSSSWQGVGNYLGPGGELPWPWDGELSWPHHPYSGDIPWPSTQTKRRRNLIARMRGKATVKMTTDDILAVTRGKFMEILMDSNVILDVVMVFKNIICYA